MDKRELRRKARRCARNPRLQECNSQEEEENDVITRDFDLETSTSPPDANLVTEVFNGIIPVTEIGSYTKPPRRTLSSSTSSIPTTMITNLTLASPAEIATNPRPVAMDGWMLLVGILAGTIIMVTLIWNTVKLWCRKNEREAMRRPGVIAYLTEDEAITAPGHGRLAEVPLERLHELSIALSPGNIAQASPGEIMLTNSQLNRLIVAGESTSNYQIQTGTPVRPGTPLETAGNTADLVSPEPSAPLSPTLTTTSNLPPPPAYSAINPHPPQDPENTPRPPSDSDDSDSGENNEPRESQTTNL